MTSSTELAAKKLPELQSMAQQLGIKGISKMRKGELVAAAPLSDLRRESGEQGATLERLFLEMTDDDAGAR